MSIDLLLAPLFYRFAAICAAFTLLKSGVLAADAILMSLLFMCSEFDEIRAGLFSWRISSEFQESLLTDSLCCNYYYDWLLTCYCDELSE